MSAIQINNLTKIYRDGTEALKGINLEVQPGDFFALLGANGAGKTTIIGILTGLVKKTGGSASVFGFDVTTHSRQARDIMGVVPQEFNFNQFEKTIDIVVNQAGFFGIDRDTALKRTEELLKSLELWDKRNTVARSLSGGMKRRLMIARALVNNPKLLILDEPTAGVDVELRYSMWEFLEQLNKGGTTVLLTTHYLEEVERMCRRAAMIKDGEIVKNDMVRNLMNMVDEETHIVHVQEVMHLDKLNQYKPKVIDENTFEIELTAQNHFNAFIKDLSTSGMSIVDLRPKANKMEKLFLKLLKDK